MARRRDWDDERSFVDGRWSRESEEQGRNVSRRVRDNDGLEPESELRERENEWRDREVVRSQRTGRERCESRRSRTENTPDRFDNMYEDITRNVLSGFVEPEMRIYKSPIETNCGRSAYSDAEAGARLSALEQRVNYLYSILFNGQ